MTPGAEDKPELHWWEASALDTTSSLLLRVDNQRANWRVKFPNNHLSVKPGFHIVVSVVSVVSVVRKKFIGQIQLYGNLPYKCSIQKKRQIHRLVRDRMNSICPMNFFRTTDTTGTTDTTIWKPVLVIEMNPHNQKKKDLAPVVQTMDSVIHRLNNWGQDGNFKVSTLSTTHGTSNNWISPKRHKQEITEYPRL